MDTKVRPCPPHMVVVGFGPVAARFAEDLLPLLQEGRLRLTILGAEDRPAYQRIRIGDVAVGRSTARELSAADPDQWASAGAEVRCGVTVTELDAVGHRLTVQALGGAGIEYVPYDKLLLATGAEPITPRMNVELRRRGTIDGELARERPDGAPLPEGVIALRTLEDAEQMHLALQSDTPVVVLGGGVLGTEAALAVAETGRRVTLLHRGSVPMSRELDTDSGMLLRRELIAAGVDVRSACDVSSVVSEAGRLTAVRTSLGERVPAGLLVTCTGVRARDQLAARAGLATSWGVHVDRQSRSITDPDVFAAGDCAAVGGRASSGTIAPGWLQAEAAAAAVREDLGLMTEPLRDAAGDPVGWGSSGGSGRAEALDVMMVKSKTLSVACAGDVDVDPWDPEAPTVSTWSDPKAGQYLRVVTDSRDGEVQDGAGHGSAVQLLGFVSVGMPRSAAELAVHCSRGTLPAADRTALLAAEHATKEAPLGPEDVLCRCSGATAGQVEDAAACCETVDEVGAECRAGTGCGTCRKDIERLLAAAG